MGSLCRQIFALPKKITTEVLHRKNAVSLVHIIDHSNAIYLPKLNRIDSGKKIITCHDLIAIRTAKGDFAQAPATSKSGKSLQNWISASLHHADFYACDSKQTLEDLNCLIPLSKGKSSILHLGTEPSVSTNPDKKPYQKIFPLIFKIQISFSMWEVQLGIKIERLFSVPLSMLTLACQTLA